MVDAVIVGSINMDVVISVARFPAPGETITGTDLNHYPGGKGANQAVALARMGKTVAMIANVGDDGHGTRLKTGLEQNGVVIETVGTKAGISSGQAFITVDESGENNIVLIPGANELVTPADVDARQDLFTSAGVLLVQFEIPMNTIVHALALAKRHGKLTVVNPAPALPLAEARAAIELTDVLVVNETEATILSGVSVSGVEQCEAAGRKLMELGPRVVILTLGDKGAVVVEADNAIHVTAPTVETVDTTAAGDAFIGALVSGLIDKLAVKDAVELANCAGALAVTKPGAQPSLPTYAEIHAFQGRQSATEGMKSIS